ncbi:MAG: helix-turn-helix domain-containing protein [Acutalibacteraceae bacterium]
MRNRPLFPCGQKQITLGQLATSSGVPKSTVKDIIYGKSRNPGIVTIKVFATASAFLFDFIDAPEFKTYEQEIE